MSLKKQKINFTQVQNELLVRSDLDFGLKGLFTYIMSKPDGWEFSSYRIAQETKESDRTIKTMINKLIEFNYLLRIKHTSGKITYETFLYPECKKATVKNLHGDKTSPLSNTDKKSNTKKEVKIQKEIELPKFVDRELWNDFMDVRKQKKAVQSDRALKMLINDLEKFEKESPSSANKAIEESIKNSWKGLFAPKKGPFNYKDLPSREIQGNILYLDYANCVIYDSQGKRSYDYDLSPGGGISA